MFTTQQFANIFEEALSGFMENDYVKWMCVVDKDISYVAQKVKSSAEGLYEYLKSLEKVNPNSPELFEKFSEFANDCHELLKKVDENYESGEYGLPEGKRSYHKNFITKNNEILNDFLYGVKNANELKEGAFKRFISRFTYFSQLEVENPEEKKEEKLEQEINTNIEPEVEQETEPEVEQETEPKVESEVDPEECANFKKLATILDKAKTFKNSQEYKDLITMCNALGNPETFAGMGGNVRKEMLAATGKKINDYISHKAKDGVKPNVFKKFAAVEALSKYLDKKLEPYKDEVISVGGQMDVDVSQLHLDVEKYRQSMPYFQRIAADTVTCPIENFANINPRQGVVQNNMYLATNLLRKVGYEYEVKNVRNTEVVREINSVARMFSDPEFAAAELSGKNMDIEANQKHEENQIIL